MVSIVSYSRPSLKIIALRTQFHIECLNSVLNVKALEGAFNQEKALVGAFFVIVQPVVEPMENYTALTRTGSGDGGCQAECRSSAIFSVLPEVTHI